MSCDGEDRESDLSDIGLVLKRPSTGEPLRRPASVLERPFSLALGITGDASKRTPLEKAYLASRAREQQLRKQMEEIKAQVE